MCFNQEFQVSKMYPTGKIKKYLEKNKVHTYIYHFNFEAIFYT